jgi:hypothetical protein
MKGLGLKMPCPANSAVMSTYVMLTSAFCLTVTACLMMALSWSVAALSAVDDRTGGSRISQVRITRHHDSCVGCPRCHLGIQVGESVGKLSRRWRMDGRRLEASSARWWLREQGSSVDDCSVSVKKILGTGRARHVRSHPNRWRAHLDGSSMGSANSRSRRETYCGCACLRAGGISRSGPRAN